MVYEVHYDAENRRRLLTLGRPTNPFGVSNYIIKPGGLILAAQPPVYDSEPITPGGTEFFSEDFEDGTDGNIIRYATNGSTSSVVISDPTARSDYVLRLRTNSSGPGNNTGNRAVIDTTTWSGDLNLPTEATYSTWFYLVDNQSHGNTIFEFKQKWRLGLAPHLGGSYNTQTAVHLYDVHVIHEGGGQHRVVHGSRLRTNGDMWTSGGSILSVQDRGTATGRIATGEWHQLTWQQRFSTGGDGFVRIWINEEQFVNENRVTELPLYQTGPEPTGVNWQVSDQSTFTHDPRQFIVANYMYNGGNPASTDIYFDDILIEEPA